MNFLNVGRGMGRTFKPASFYLGDDDSFEHHGATVLLLVRNGVCKDWRDFCRVFHFDQDGREFHSGHFGLKGTIDKLQDAGLLESADRHFGPYRVTEAALESLHALGLSLTQAANLLRYSGMAVRPFFGKPARLDKAAHVFVVMPFAPALRPVFSGPIRRAARRLGLSVERADDIFSNGAIVVDIWKAIINSFVVVADCTGRNPNVFYELGIAHAVGKPVVLLTQESSDVPFDIRHLRLIRYKATAAGFQRLESALQKTLAKVQETVWVPEAKAKRRSK
ncbi:MAG: hypothetical protein U1F61_08920 [Opitutaceae bacterium]|jgi:hypothetical protein